MDDFGLKKIFRFKIAIQNFKDNWKITLILTILFTGMAALYGGMYPEFENALKEMTTSGIEESFSFFRGSQDMASYAGFLNIEFYQLFWILILAIILGFISASSISKEIENKTIDLLMSNPISNKQIIFEKYIGLIPTVLIVNIGALAAVFGITNLINEELNFAYLILTHLCSIPYFFAVIGIGILISVIINEKMKASITMIAIIMGMYIFESLSQMIPDYEAMGYLSITHYYNPYDTLKYGDVDVPGMIVLLLIAMWTMIIAMIYFEHRDIEL
ncbi:MAG: ABC transporter permease subunit [Candidatus Thermoplasmatota archaeon]